VKLEKSISGTHVRVDSSITSIHSSCFQEREDLVSVEIPDSVMIF